jgi:SAM-dependent methyltransferase
MHHGKALAMLELDHGSTDGVVGLPAGEGLEDTGERMLPLKADATPFWEHIYRYRFAIRFVPGRRVLDIACGEGYGTAALARAGAARVLGVDLSEETCEHARRKYGVDARVGDACCVPLPDRSLDVIVSFETIEHLAAPAIFLDECRRLLVPGGTLVISTPNREAFQQVDGANPFHCAEMTEDEFTSLLASRFKRWELYTQRPRTAPRWNARSLAADSSPWHAYRTYHRLRRIFAPLCPHHNSLYGEVGDQYREFPVEAILARDLPFACYANPYSVMRQPRAQREQPYYFVAVARV